MRRIVALVPSAPGTSPGQRVRIETWAPHLQSCGWTVELIPFEDEALHSVLYETGRYGAKAGRLAACYLRQLGRVVGLTPADVLFVYREAAIVGPALLERLARRHSARLIYDLDDPTFLPYRSPTNGWLSTLKFPGKTRSLCRMADRVIAVNHLIGGYAGRFNPAVTVVPNFVDVEVWKPAGRAAQGAGSGPVRLVWIGGHTTTDNLQTILPALRRLQAERAVELRVVAGPPVDLAGVEVDWRRWSAASEVADLAECDIGLVPLTDLAWNNWKFFYKTIQYMAVGLPVVARRMGSNAEVVSDGVDGFLVEDQEEWFQRLRTLVDDVELRRRMGAAARAAVVERYSSRTQLPRVAAAFTSSTTP